MTDNPLASKLKTKIIRISDDALSAGKVCGGLSLRYESEVVLAVYNCITKENRLLSLATIHRLYILNFDELSGWKSRIVRWRTFL